ncbi:hypothetical protein Sste5346_009861 [Sporothrix stenoceras]|uniref:Cyclase n=1 Tax=Sporothrix stenoceras TaxID=5173 RepID=A0ABR3YI28_9PEZI
MPKVLHQKRSSRTNCLAKPTAKRNGTKNHVTNGVKLKQQKQETHASPTSRQRPTFSELPLHPSHPKASAWGLYGTDDELGTLNLLTAEAVRAAAASEIRSGERLPLNLPLTTPVLPMNPRRKPCVHNIISKGYANDDELHLNTQASSHWDGLRHYPYQEAADGTHEGGPRYYNGVTQADISGLEKNERIGIQGIAERGVAGRGVLLDWRSWALEQGIAYSPFESHAIPLEQLKAVAVAQGIGAFREGDILLVRSGWIEEYRKLSPNEQVALAERPDRSFVGVEASRAMLEWHWDNGFAAVAGDTNAYEAWPPRRDWGVSCHEVFLSGWGMPIGELWDLDALAAHCKALGRWTFFLTSCPLNIPSGVASPPNALAIF